MFASVCFSFSSSWRLAGCQSDFLISLHLVTPRWKLRSAGLVSRAASSAEPRKEMQQNVANVFFFTTQGKTSTEKGEKKGTERSQKGFQHSTETTQHLNLLK